MNPMRPILLMYNKYTTEELLVGARDLVAQGWCQKMSAQDENGRTTPFGGPKAVKFCMSGAMCHLMDCVTPQWQKANVALLTVVGYAIELWNDQPERTQAEVLEAFDKALAIVRESGKVTE